MLLLAKVIGILIACMGAVIVMNPAVMKKMISFWRQDNRIYIGGLLRFLFGIVFLLSAPEAERFPWVIYVFGVLSFLGAILIFAIGLNKAKAILEWWDRKPSSLLQLMGILVFSIGALVFYSA